MIEMHYYLIVPLAVTHAKTASLTYQYSEVLSLGQVVMVPVGKKIVAGIVIKKVDKPSFATKPIESMLENTVIPAHLIKLADWLVQFYDTHPVSVWQTILPRGIQKKRRLSTKKHSYPERNRTNIVLNSDQQAAVERIWNETYGTNLLHGITGSGKTEIYIETAKRTIAAGKSAIVLVPEIALTSQIIAEFTPHFPDLVVTHSTMSEAERHTAWLKLLNASTPQLVIGPRSALFSPVKDLGLIVIDECHEPSFKQEQAPKYSALRAAAFLSDQTKSRLILGSATPSVSDYYLATITKRPIIRITSKARTGTVEPIVDVVDMTKKHNFGRHRFLSDVMIKRITEAIAAKKQVLMFHNRRGTAPTTLCENCGWSAACPRCFVPLTLHADAFQLRCHLCDYSERVPTSCPECGQANIIHKGIGTKLLHSEMIKLFPQAVIARFDGDSSGEDTLEKQYQALYDGDIDIIIGTQVVAKGLDLPHLRMVGVVQADSGLSLPDYQSPERVFQLLYQVCGRVGRNEHASHVVVQSYQPTHPAVAFGIQKDYEGFYEYALAERQRANFPPFRHLLKLTCTYKTEDAAIRASQDLARRIKKQNLPHVEVLGPTPAFYERVRDQYRWQLILKSPKRDALIDIIDSLPPSPYWTHDLDPASLL